MARAACGQRTLVLSALLALGALLPLYAQNAPTVSLGSFVFDSQLFGDTLVESDGGIFRSGRWLNIIRSDPGNPGALTGSNFDTGIANIGRGTQPVYTIGYNTPILNRTGADLAIVSARFSTTDTFDLAVSVDGTSFTPFVSFGPDAAVDTGEVGSYYFGGDPTGGPFAPGLFVTAVDLSAFGIAEGVSIRAVMITSSPQGDLIRVAGFAGNRVSFDIPSGSTEKVLTHKYGQNDAYLSSYQTNDREITISGTVADPAGAPVGGVPLYLRVIDPSDTSAYVPAASKQPNDNADPADQSGTNLNARLSTTSITSGANGRFAVTLTVSDQYAGDNYRVEASFDQAFPCAPANGPSRCAQTGLIEVWKRVYIEMNEMYRESQILVADAPAGTRFVYVNDRGFRNNDDVRLIHAPSYLRNQSTDAGGFYFEDRAIVRVRRNPNPNIPAAFEIELDAPLTRLYRTDLRVAGIQLGDAIVNLTRNPQHSPDPVYRMNEQYVISTFAEAFVDVNKLPPNGAGVPLYEAITELALPFAGGKWFAARTSANPPPPNTGLALAAATRAALQNMPNALSLGTTGGVYSYVWRQNIDDATAGPRHQFPLTSGHNPDLISGEVLVHELAHQWSVNTTYPANECDKNSYADPTKFCQGNGPQNSGQYDDGQVKFHYVGASPATADSEYMTIRKASEPRPQ